MRFIITGATGFIGQALTRYLLDTGHEIVALSRNIESGQKVLGDRATVLLWDGCTARGWSGYADGADAVINLAGENIAGGYWSDEQKQRILNSRIDAGRAVTEAIEQAGSKPAVLIQASATGYYGSRNDDILDESSESGTGFLAEVVRRWEGSVKRVEKMGVRLAVIRTGLVLGRAGGIFPRFLLPFRMFAGGPLGNGQQWLPWIHLDDVVRTIEFLIENESMHGVFNLTAPNPVSMDEFCRVLGRTLHRPSFLRVPAFALRLIFGEMADETILSGQRAVPKRLLDTGFQFRFPYLEAAIRDLMSCS